jgi:hypothetical protein
MKKRNSWAAFGISAAVAAALITAIILIAGAIKMNNAPEILPITPPVSQPLPLIPPVPPPSNINGSDTTSENLKIISPKLDERLKSPFIVSGEARGWYFEGSFPVELQDANGVTLANGVAQAQGDWMSAGFVPFIATLEFNNYPRTGRGTLILTKDNPSGMPQYDERVSIPVKFVGELMPGDIIVGCRPTGCQDEICSDQYVSSSCVYNEALVCYRDATCTRQDDGQCGWTMTPELRSCLETAGMP